MELLPEGMSFDYTQPADGLTKEKNSPLAVALFGFDFVSRVFITNNFITLTKTESVAWEDELFGIKTYLKKYFEEKHPVFSLPEATIAIQVSGAFGSRQEEAQRLGRILRPKADGRGAKFYSVVSRDTIDQDFAQNRQRFLAEQGYSYKIIDADDVFQGKI